MPNIAKHVERLMNPLSHDDKEVPLYRRELENAFIEVEKYEPIRDAKTVLVDQKDAGVRKFKMMITDGVTTIEVEFVTTEQWDYIVFPAPTGKKYKDCEVMIVSCLGWTYPINSKIRVKFLYNDIRNCIFHGAAGAPAFDQTITDVASGLLLCAL